MADPCADTAESAAWLLRAWGFRVRTAATGPAALETALAHRPGAVVMEVGLPGLSGWEVARRLRQEYGRSAPLLVAVTGRGGEQDRARSREAGFDYHLVKPVCPAALRGLLVTGFADTGGREMSRAVAERSPGVRVRDVVDVASDDSFPASDPLSWTPVTRVGSPYRAGRQRADGKGSEVSASPTAPGRRGTPESRG